MEPRNQKTAASNGGLFSLRVFGVPVRFHFTFVLFVIFLAVIGLEGPSGAQAAIYVLALFGSVLLHEFGHSFVSRRYGIRTIEIVLFPIGGVARLERNPKPAEELWIALAGPAVNIVIAGVLIGLAAGLFGSLDWDQVFRRRGGNLLGQVALGNIVLALFNLLPAFPMDGGRVLRSMLALKYGESQATELAAKAGRILAIGMGLYGLISANYMLIFIAFFVYLGAAQESAALMGRQLTQGVPVSAAMITDFRTLSHGQTIRDAANLLLATSQQDFPVMSGSNVIGLLSRGTLLRAMAQEGPDSYVAGVMERDFLRLDPRMDLSEAMLLLAQAGTCALVMEGEELRGLLTAENLTEFLLLRRLDRTNVERA
ncbi:MAG: site-2 protease family protein [Bryobacteraceae bacterium]|nr:site-2 protease family protein [Bryobacteraceae bacterium]MDW8379301.1 site-2 protease family protein [Bryobacterales bacterium]